MFSHTEELWYKETVCLWMTIYTLPLPGVELFSELLLVATHVMQSTTKELSTSVSDLKM